MGVLSLAISFPSTRKDTLSALNIKSSDLRISVWLLHYKTILKLLICPQCLKPAKLVVGRNNIVFLVCDPCQKGWILADLLQDSSPPPLAQPGDKDPHSSTSGLCRRLGSSLKSDILKALLFGLFFVVVSGLSMFSGYAFANHQIFQVEAVESPIDVETALQYLARSERSHQQYIDNPGLLEDIDLSRFGDLEHHRDCVTRYQQIAELLMRLSEK